MAGKCFLERVPDDYVYTLWTKKFVKITLSCTVSKINSFLCFTQNFKMAAKYGGITIADKYCQMNAYNLGAKTFTKVAVSKITNFHDGRQKYWGNIFSQKVPDVSA